MRPKQLAASLVIAVFLLPTVPVAQIPEFEFYADFLQWLVAVAPDRRGSHEKMLEMLEPYGEKLRAQGVASSEINRRLTLIRTSRQALETDLWNRTFTGGAQTFNTEPNAFLVSVVQGRPPGRALDVGMGEGRNALHLAKLGWEVTGFDPADKAIAMATRRAEALGLKVTALVASDAEFDFGRDQWDLILFSWVPLDSARRAVDALRPNGIVVAEGGRDFFPMNGLLKVFDSLRVLRYEDQLATSDWMGRKQMQIVRLVAEKPAR